MSLSSANVSHTDVPILWLINAVSWLTVIIIFLCGRSIDAAVNGFQSWNITDFYQFLNDVLWIFVEFCREGCNAEKLTTEIIIVCSAALRGVVLLHSACILYHLRSYMCVQIHMINSAFYPFRFGKLVPAVTQKATTILGLSVQRLSFSYAADPVYAFLCTSVMKW